MAKLFEYERDYTLLQTFEPFRQRNRDLALISRDYTTTAVVDLESGSVIAEEIDGAGQDSVPLASTFRTGGMCTVIS